MLLSKFPIKNQVASTCENSKIGVIFLNDLTPKWAGKKWLTGINVVGYFFVSKSKKKGSFLKIFAPEMGGKIFFLFFWNMNFSLGSGPLTRNGNMWYRSKKILISSDWCYHWYYHWYWDWLIPRLTDKKFDDQKNDSISSDKISNWLMINSFM